MRKQQKSAQEIQDDIFRRMNAGEKIKLGSDFCMYGIKHGLKEGTPVPDWYLKQWLKKNSKIRLLHIALAL